MALGPIKGVTNYTTAQGASPGLCPEEPFRLLLCDKALRGSSIQVYIFTFLVIHVTVVLRKHGVCLCLCVSVCVRAHI